MYLKLPRFLIALFMLLSCFFIVPNVHAADAPTTCTPGISGLNLSHCLKLNDKQTVPDIYSKPSILINLLVKNGFVVAGLIFFFLMIFAGVQFITGGTKGAEQAKSVMETALIGFMLMFAAYWIIQIIKAVTGADIQL